MTIMKTSNKNGILTASSWAVRPRPVQIIARCWPGPLQRVV